MEKFSVKDSEIELDKAALTSASGALILESKDFMLIKAINSLTESIQRLATK